MEWRDEGVILAVRPHGESAAIIEVFTASHGRHAGVVRGGAGRKLAPILQPGSQVDLTWRARLEDHLGAFVVEPIRARSAVLGDRRALAGLTAVCGLLQVALPERAPQPELYALTVAVLDAIEAGRADWPGLYLHWEIALLEDMGFGLDLSCCAVTGAVEGLAYVSPKSGRAVSRAGAGDWADRLLPLPRCLTEGTPPSEDEVLEGLSLTGWFLQHRLAPELARGVLPEARARLLRALTPR